MWSITHEQKVTGVSRQRVWDVWTDVDRWPSWQDDVEYAHLEGNFCTGSVVCFKPKGGPKVRIELAANPEHPHHGWPAGIRVAQACRRRGREEPARTDHTARGTSPSCLTTSPIRSSGR